MNKSLSVNLLRLIGQVGTLNTYVVLSAKYKGSFRRGIWVKLENFNSMYQATDNVF